MAQSFLLVSGSTLTAPVEDAAEQNGARTPNPLRGRGTHRTMARRSDTTTERRFMCHLHPAFEHPDTLDPGDLLDRERERLIRESLEEAELILDNMRS